ncbi:hypothetical protein PCE1_002931 [Barthelona sp. PCE]
MSIENLPMDVQSYISDLSSLKTDISVVTQVHEGDDEGTAKLRLIFRAKRSQIRKACKASDPNRTRHIPFETLVGIIKESDCDIHKPDLYAALEVFGDGEQLDWNAFTRNLSFEWHPTRNITINPSVYDLMLRVAVPKTATPVNIEEHEEHASVSHKSVESHVADHSRSTSEASASIGSSFATSITNRPEYANPSPLGPSFIESPFYRENLEEGDEFLLKKRILGKVESLAKNCRLTDVQNTHYINIRVFKSLLRLFHVAFTQKELEAIVRSCGEGEQLNYMLFLERHVPDPESILSIVGPLRESPLWPELERWSHVEALGREAQLKAGVINDNISPNRWLTLTKRLHVPGSPKSVKGPVIVEDRTTYFRKRNALLTRSELGKPKKLLMKKQNGVAGMPTKRQDITISDLFQDPIVIEKPSRPVSFRPPRTNRATELKKEHSKRTFSAYLNKK